MSKKYTSLTEIVSVCYCEQKTVFDIQFGKQKTARTKQYAIEGEKAHKAFERRGRVTGSPDSRCFIATAVYGDTANETNFLRHWRDTTLLTTGWGRVLVIAYYRLSPPLAALAKRVPVLQRIARMTLDNILRYLGYVA